MNCKRKATVLVVMLLLDFCHGHPTPPSASHQPPSSDQQPVLDNDDDDTSGNTDQQASIAKEDLSVLNDFFNENGVYFRGANKTFCGEAGEQKFYKSIKSTPVAGELYGVLSGVILALEGCTEKSAIRLAELEISFNSNPVLIHAVNKMINALENEENQLAAGYAKLTTDEVKENQAEGRNTEQDAVMVLMQMLESQENQTESTYQADDEEDVILDENFTNAIQGNIKNITTELQILESVLPEEKQLGIVECRWRTGSENATETCFLASVNKEHFHWNQAISKDEYGRILEAKLACEKWGSECVGFSTRQNIPFYYLLKECSNLGIALPSNRITDPLFHFLNSTTTPPSDGNGTTYLWPDSSNENITTELWFKDCSRNQNSDANNTTFTRRPSHVISHVGRRDAESDASVTVYEHINYAGASIILTGAVDTIDQAWNNKISSLRFPERDWSVVAFEDPNFRGRQAAFIGDTSFVGSEMNDRISSMIVLPYRLDQLCFSVYEHANFQGRHQRLCGDHDFTSGSNWNKMISSLRVESQECGLILYDRSYDGKFKMFNGNVPYVGNEWNDKTSSIQIRPWILENHEGQIQPITIFYADAHYQGQSTAVKGTTDYIGRRMNDKVSSVKCDGECALLVFEHSNYEGQSRLYDGSQRDLSNFNDKLSSALVLMNRICVTFYEHSNYRGHSRQDCSDVDVFPSDWNDRVSSLTVDCTYCSVILYEHGSYQGDYKAFAGKVPYVGGHWNDLISSLQIRPWKLQNYERKTEKSCVDPGEKKAYNVIQWIPLISTLYSLGTSIYYGATGCHSAARERAVDLALDVVMDVATIATSGAAGAAAYGIKTGVKGGVKIGLHAAKKALTSTIKNSVKKGLKSGVKIASRGITGNVKSLGKSVIRSAKGIANAAKNLPGAVKAGIKDVGRGLTKVSHQSIGKTAKEGATKLKNTLQRSFDDLADSAKRQVDEVGTASKSGKTNVNLCRRKRMINAPHCSKTELPQRHLNAQARALSESRREQAQNFFNEFKGSPSFKYSSSTGAQYDTIQVTIPNEAVSKDVLHNLAYYHDFMPDGATLVKPNGKTEMTKYALKVNMKFGNEPFEFIMTPSRDRQIFIGFTNKIDDSVSHSYDGIIKQLDSGAPAQNAETILKVINARGDEAIDWGTMTREQREAAKELIVLTHVAEGAVPDPAEVKNILNLPLKDRKPNSVQGGVGGIDKTARSYFDRIKADTDVMSFEKAFNTKDGEFIIARVGGKKQQKNAIFRPDSVDKRTRRLLQEQRDAMSDSSVDLRKRRSIRLRGGN